MAAMVADGQPASHHRAGGIWLARVLLGIYVVSMAGGVVAVVAGTSVPMVTAPSMVLLGLIGLVLAVRCWRHDGLGRRTRRAWGIMSVAAALMLIFPVLFGVFGGNRFPGPGDVVRLAFTGVFLVGLLTFPLGALDRSERRKIGLDVVTVVVGGFSVLWYLVVGPGTTGSGVSARTIVAASAYPVADLVLIFGLATVLLRGTDASIRRPLVLLAAGGGCFVVADVYLGYVRSHELPIAMIDTWPTLVYLSAHLLFAMAAYEQYRHPGGGAAPAGAARRIPVAARLPYIAVAVAYALMLVAAVRDEHPFPWSGLVLGGIAITGVVMARQVLVQRESHHMAITDGLTGLANRLHFYDALSRALARDQGTGQTTGVVLADMDGFKAVNDTFGHNAGDQVIVEFGTVLRRVVLGSDVVGRLGGDEFAIVLRNIGNAANAEAVVRRILAEMRHPVTVGGSSITMRASFGVAVCHAGEASADELLHRADLAMYQAKHRGTTGFAFYHSGMSQQQLGTDQGQLAASS